MFPGASRSRSILLSGWLAALAGCAAAPARPATEVKPASAPPPTATAAPDAPVPVSAAAGVFAEWPSTAAGNNLLWNGTFDKETLRPWSLAFDSPRLGQRASSDGELCLRIDDAGKRTFDIVLRQSPLAITKGHQYQVRFRAHATAATHVRAKIGSVRGASSIYWTAEAAVGDHANTFTSTFVGPIDNDAAELALEFGGHLSPAPLMVCLDDLEVNDPQFEIPVERTHKTPLPKVRVNQVGYLPGFAKTAVVVTAETAPQTWELVDAGGKVRATGKTHPFGEDRSSGERVQQIDFSSYTTPGRGLKLRVGADESYPFAVGDDVYRRLKYDALSFFYLQRSGVDIKLPYAGSAAYERPAGHLGDKSVPCAPSAKCNYRLDVSGGWYDAGDHGKYVVNSGISVWTLQNQYEALTRFCATAGDFGDKKMNIPEGGNGFPDLLDEARFNLEFMLNMQVPDGQPHAGMAHQRIHGEKWSDLPTMPSEDRIPRFLRAVSTGATYDLAATAAQGARVWQKLDPSFAARCLTVAEKAFAAGKASPIIYAEPLGQGGGAYGDGDLSDELYWAAAELYLTTGKSQYKDELTKSRFHT